MIIGNVELLHEAAIIYFVSIQQTICEFRNAGVIIDIRKALKDVKTKRQPDGWLIVQVELRKNASYVHAIPPDQWIWNSLN